MAIKTASHVKEVASNKPNAATAFNLPDSAAAGYQSFDSAFASGDVVPYFATNGTAWESGLGTFTAGTPDTLARTTILESSTGSAIDWSSGGDVTVFVEYPAKIAEQLFDLGQVYVVATTAQQSIPLSTWTKMSGCLANEVIDVNGWWDATNKRFQPTRAGKYSVSAWVRYATTSSSAAILVLLYKNGSMVYTSPIFPANANSTTPSALISGLIDLNGSTDYVEAYTYHWGNAGAIDTLNDPGSCGFSAYFEGF